MSTTLSSTIQAQVGWTWRNRAGSLLVTDNSQLLFRRDLADGADANQADAVWRAVNQSLAAGQATLLCLGALQQPLFGDTITVPLARVKAILIVNKTASGDGYLVGRRRRGRRVVRPVRHDRRHAEGHARKPAACGQRPRRLGGRVRQRDAQARGGRRRRAVRHRDRGDHAAGVVRFLVELTRVTTCVAQPPSAVWQRRGHWPRLSRDPNHVPTDRQRRHPPPRRHGGLASGQLADREDRRRQDLHRQRHRRRRARLPGAKDSSGRLEIKATDSGHVPLAEGDAVALALHADDSGQNYYELSAVIDAVRVEVNIASAKPIAYLVHFSGSGPITAYGVLGKG